MTTGIRSNTAHKARTRLESDPRNKADPTVKNGATAVTAGATATNGTTAANGSTAKNGTTATNGTEPVRLSSAERAQSRARFTAETGANLKAFELHAQIDVNAPKHKDPPNTAPIGAAGSAVKIATSPPPGVPTLGDLHAAIQGFAKDPSIPFSYVPDGCYARADVMAKSLNAKGIPTTKVWAYAQDMGKPLEVPGAEWGYHVAPQVKAWNPETGAVGDYVVDPSMSGKPMTPSEWVGKMNPNQGPVRVEVTPNEAYVPNGRGGYVGTKDPLVQSYNMGPDQTIKNYSNEMTARGLKPNSGPPDGIPTNAEVAASNTGKLARLGSAVSRGLGVVAAVGGGFQFANGVSEWKKGNKLDGGVDMASGGLNVAGGVAIATGAGTVAAPFLFGASSIIDGGRDLYHGVQNGNGEKIGVGTAKVAGGGMMVAGGVLCATGVGVPVGVALIAGGAIVSGGAAVYDAFHEQINGAVSTVANGVKDTVSSVKNTVSNAASSAWNTVTSWF